MFKKLFGGLLGSRPEVSTAPNFEQRRKTARRPCDIEVEASFGRKSSFLQVVDLSVSGMRLHCSTPLALKSKTLVRVTYPEPIPKYDLLTVECLVRWTRIRETDSSQFIGVEFKEPKSLGKSWVKAKMEDLGFRPFNLREQRAKFRVESNIPATLDIAGASVKCFIRNIGLGGLFINLRHPIRAGSQIEIKVGDHPHLGGSVYNVTVRHEQQPEPADPFGYGCLFVSLRENQAEAIREFLVAQSETQWENTQGSIGFFYEDFATAEETTEIEIPDLQSILAQDDEDETEE